MPRSRPSLPVDEELSRAVRHESAGALRFWWGINVAVVWRWRRALGVTRTSNEGSRHLIRAASERGGERTRGVPLPADQVGRRRTAIELNLGRHLRTGYHEPWWTKAELALLGRVPDAEVARWTGRTVIAVRQKREALERARLPGRMT